MNDRRRPRPPAKPKPAAPLSGPIELDTETRNALILFNARIEAQEAVEREKRRVDRAARAKDEAAAKVRGLENDPKASADDKAAAQAAYLAALEAWNRAKAGEPEPAPAAEPAGGEAASEEPPVDDTGEAPVDDTPAEDATADVTPADDAPADESPANEVPASDGEAGDGDG